MKNTYYYREEENKNTFIIFFGDIMKTKESNFQSKLIRELHGMFPGCIVTKLDPKHIQGMPDILILYEDKWAVLECKRSAKEHKQPNQEYYISKMGSMSYASFIYPENKKEVLDELQQAFRHRRKTCISKS